MTACDCYVSAGVGHAKDCPAAVHREALKAASEIRIKLSRHWRKLRFYPAEQDHEAAKIIQAAFDRMMETR